jgi:acetolactate synthase-1/2/3 large subunit
MYTIQALWTIAREGLDVTTIIFNNRSYGILNIELERVGADKIGPKAKAQLDLSEPAIDFVSMAKGMGVAGQRTATAEEFNAALEKAVKTRGPYLIEAIVPSEYEGLKLKVLPHMLNALGRVPSPVAKAIKKKIAP